MSSIRDLCNASEDDQDLKPVPDIDMEISSRSTEPPTWSLSSSSSLTSPPMSALKYDGCSGYGPPHSYSLAYYPQYAPHPSHYPQQQQSYQHHHPQHQSSRYPRYTSHQAQSIHYPRHSSSEPQCHDHHRSLSPPLPSHGYASYYDNRRSPSASNYHYPSEHRQRQQHNRDPHTHTSLLHRHQNQYRHAQEGYASMPHVSHERRMSAFQLQQEISRDTEERRVSHPQSSTSSSRIALKPDMIFKREQHQQQAQSQPRLQTSRQHVQQEELSISKARIKIVQQPKHARMCGFGEKDRRPIDPPPIIQLIIDDDPIYDQPCTPPKPVKSIMPSKKKGKNKETRSCRRSGKKVQDAAVAAEAIAKRQQLEEAAGKKEEEEGEGKESGDDQDGDKGELAGRHEENDDEPIEDCLNDHEDFRMDDGSGSKDKRSLWFSSRSANSGRGRSASLGSACEKIERIKTSTSPPPAVVPKRRGRPPRDSALAGKKHYLSGKTDLNDSDSEVEWPRYEGGAEALRVDPLYVLHASLWSEDGSEVRNMIATPGQSDPPKLTRILMGGVVVSPILLNDEHGKSGWYFSFPDLSIRTEGKYTLKFSLMRFANFDFDDFGGNYASTLVAEETSETFAVFSAKKFPGMTESTDLSKAFAKQGLKISIRNDLRVRRNADNDE